MDKKDLIMIRDFQNDDLNFILATWLRGLYYGNDWFHKIFKETFFKNYQIVIEKIMQRPGIKVHVCCLKEDPHVILGYSVIEPGILHWVFVKQAWRKIGIARDLIPDTTQTVTHLTNRSKSIETRFHFNPFLF